MSGDLARRDADATLWFCGRRRLVVVPHPRDGEVPMRFLPITDLPRNSTGTFDRKQLREQAASLMGPPALPGADLGHSDQCSGFAISRVPRCLTGQGASDA